MFLPQPTSLVMTATAMFSNQWFSFWQQCAADRILHCLIAGVHGQSFPATETWLLLRDGRYPQGYKDRRNGVM